MRIGIDLGGTKIEALAIGDDGTEMVRHRVDTPREYGASIAAMVALVERIERETGQRGTVGAGIPGTVSSRTGLVKNANSTWLNGMPLTVDLGAAMGREVRVANDANCLAVSEATDGAAAGARVVFAVILGTGCGGGVSFSGQIHNGANGVAGEWGHNPLPWATAAETPGPACYCGKHGCIETWVSGSGVAREFADVTGRKLTTRAIVEAAEAGDAQAMAAVERFEERLARSLATIVHTLDPDVIVFGGGLSRVARLYEELPGKMAPYVFGGEFHTPLLPAKYGDSSGVRGAAWLWPARG
ncbi:ROK family protein [Granulicella sp. WH15]|nr:ROK family protein [Granulicella sp. WH15]